MTLVPTTLEKAARDLLAALGREFDCCVVCGGVDDDHHDEACEVARVLAALRSRQSGNETFGKRERPCGDCVDAYCMMNCGSMR